MCSEENFIKAYKHIETVECDLSNFLIPIIIYTLCHTESLEPTYKMKLSVKGA